MKLVTWFTLSFFLMTFNLAIGQKTLRPEMSAKPSPETRVYYSVFVQSFYDSNGDGIGDLNGLTSKLDYIKDLGVGGIWLLPIHPSPTYHKYDITDYYNIHPDYGTLEDFKNLIHQAHKRDLKVVMDLVVNHTSNRHPWFVEAASNPKSKYRDYFVWSSKESDFEAEPFHWHQVRDAKGNKQTGERYYGFFWWEMPDWNLDNKAVRKEFGKIGRFWLDEIGVDGFRLDAARYIYPDDKLQDNLDWWNEFRNSLGKKNNEAFIVAELWGSSEEVAPYLANGISAGFNFELSDSIRKSLREGVNYSIAETVVQIQKKYQQEEENFQDAPFLTNHDMNRIMTELEGNDLLAKAAATILLTLPGNPFIYYGEEIGMKGEKPDEFIREPFLWDVEGSDAGQTHWQIPYASTSNTVKPLIYQKDEPHSLFNTYRHLIRLRNESPALRSNHIIPLNTNNKAVLAYYRYGMKDSYLVFVNLSAWMQRIQPPADIKGFTTVYQSHPVFKGSEMAIVLQPYSSFILKLND